MFCINVDIDEMFLLEKNMGLISLELFPFVLLEKLLWYNYIVHAW